MACCVEYCESVIADKRSKSHRGKTDITFHQFPSNLELKKKWIVAIGRKDPKTGKYWIPHKNALVCNLHFSPAQFSSKAKNSCLKMGMIPFIFPDHHLPQRGTLIDKAELALVDLPEDRSERKNVCNDSFNSKEPLQTEIVSHNANSINGTESIAKQTTKEETKQNSALPNSNKILCKSLELAICNTYSTRNPKNGTEQTFSRQESWVDSSSEISSADEAFFGEDSDLSNLSDFSYEDGIDDLSKSSEISFTDDVISSKTKSAINIKSGKKRAFSEVSSQSPVSSQSDNIHNQIPSCSRSSFEPQINFLNKIQKTLQGMPVKVLNLNTSLIVLDRRKGNSVVGKKLCPKTNFPLSSVQNETSFASVHSDSILDKNEDTSLLTAHQTENLALPTSENLTEKDKLLLNELESEIKENQRLSDELSELQEKCEKFRLKNMIINDKLDEFNIKQLKENVTKSDKKALFLYDQLCNLSTETPIWSECTLEFAKKLQQELPECYNFLKQKDFISLPFEI